DAEVMEPVAAEAAVGLGDVEWDATHRARGLLAERGVVALDDREGLAKTAEDVEAEVVGEKAHGEVPGGGFTPAAERTATRAGNRRSRSAPVVARAARVLSALGVDHHRNEPCADHLTEASHPQRRAH